MWPATAPFDSIFSFKHWPLVHVLLIRRANSLTTWPGQGISACLDENHLRSISITNFSQKFCINFHENLRAASCVKSFLVLSFIFIFLYTCRLALKPPPPPPPPPTTPASFLPLLLFEIYDTINFVKHLKLQSSRNPQRSLLSLPPFPSRHSLSLSLVAPIPVAWCRIWCGTRFQCRHFFAFRPTFVFLCLISH